MSPPAYSISRQSWGAPQHGDGLQAGEAADAVVGVRRRGRRSDRLVASVRTSTAERLRRGRTSRSPRMSCSPMTASSGVSKPCSRPSTARAVDEFPAAPAPRRSSRPWQAPRARDRRAGSTAARARPASTRRRRRGGAPHAGAFTWCTTASKTFTSPCWRSAAKLRPARPRQDRTCGPSTSSNGVSLLTSCALRAADHDLSSRIHALGRNRLVGRRAEGLLLERGKPRVVVLGNLLEALPVTASSAR